MLDQEHGDPELVVHTTDERGELDLLGRIRPGGRFIEEEELRARPEGTGDLEPPSRPVREGTGELVRPRAKADEIEEARRTASPSRSSFLVRGRRSIAPTGPVCWRDSTPIFTFSNTVRALKSLLVWKVHAIPRRFTRCGLRPTIWVAPALVGVEVDGARLRVVDAGEAVEKARLAGSVRADDGEQFTPGLVERHVDEALHPAEAQRDVVDVDDDVAGDCRGRGVDGRRHEISLEDPLIASAVPTPCSARPISRFRLRDGIIPSGRKIIMITRIAPR